MPSVQQGFYQGHARNNRGRFSRRRATPDNHVAPVRFQDQRTAVQGDSLFTGGRSDRRRMPHEGKDVPMLREGAVPPQQP